MVFVCLFCTNNQETSFDDKLKIHYPDLKDIIMDKFFNDISLGLETAFIDRSINSNSFYQIIMNKEERY